MGPGEAVTPPTPPGGEPPTAPRKAVRVASPAPRVTGPSPSEVLAAAGPVPPDTRPCRHCGKPVNDVQKVCHYCKGDSPYPGKRAAEPKPQDLAHGLVVLLGACLLVGVAVVCCGGVGGKRKPAYSPPEPSYKPRLTAEVVDVRLEPFHSPLGFDTQMVCVDWKNTSNRPVRAVHATLRVYDARGTVVYSAEDYTIYAEGNDRPGVAPGETYREPSDQGHVVPRDVGPSAVRATAVITRAHEEGL